MRHLKTNLLFTTLFALLLSVGSIYGQNLSVNNNASDLKIDGTSNIHDWEMDAQTIKGQANIVTEGGKLTDIKSLRVEIPAEGLKSGKSGMDKNTYKALNTNKHKNITYTLKDVRSIESSGNNTYKVSTTGDLTIAGTTKEVPLEFTAQYNGGSLSLKGEKPLNMKNFNVDPPTAMMGTIKTGEEVTIIFNTTFR